MASSSRRGAATDSSSLPVGYRFRPTEEELVSHYLKLKLQGMDASNVIAELDVCKYEPWDLPAESLIDTVDDEWFFFSRRDHKYNNSNRANRMTEKGYWKITGKERAIKARATNNVIGKKRTLTFYLGRVRNDKKTNWVIHEYYIPENLLPKQRNIVLCRLKKKSDESTDIGRLLTNEHSNNDYIALQPASGANESEDDFAQFLNSVIVEPDEDTYIEETMQTTLLNESSHPKSLMRLYAEDGGVSSDTDTEVFHGQGLQMFSEPPIASSLSRRDKDVMIYRSQSQPRSVNILKDVSSEDDMAEINRLDDDKHEINCLDLLTDEYSGEESTNTMIARSSFSAEGVLQRKAKQASERRAAVNFSHKKQSITKFDKNRSHNAEMGMKQTQYGTTASNNWKGSIIFWETSPLSPNSNPPSVYVFNMVLGIILFIVVVREVILYGNWC